MKNEIYDNMLSAYSVTTEQERCNAIFEVNQQVILAGLYNGGFFDVAAFYASKVLALAERYAQTLPEIDADITDLEAKVAAHLKQMGY